MTSMTLLPPTLIKERAFATSSNWFSSLPQSWTKGEGQNYAQTSQYQIHIQAAAQVIHTSMRQCGFLLEKMKSSPQPSVLPSARTQQKWSLQLWLNLTMSQLSVCLPSVVTYYLEQLARDTRRKRNHAVSGRLAWRSYPTTGINGWVTWNIYNQSRFFVSL